MNETESKIEYMALTIVEYAVRHDISITDAYSYLEKYQGISFLDECYNVEHTLSIDNIIED